MTLVLKSLEGDLGTNPRFVQWLARKMDAAVIAGAAEVERAHVKILAGWASKPAFFARDIIDIGRLYQARQLRVGGPNAWKWIQVNYGGSTIKQGPISGKYMRFPFQGRGRSYSAATDSGKPGQRLGAPTVFFNVTQRAVAPRDMIGRVSRNNRQQVYAAMKRGFENG